MKWQVLSCLEEFVFILDLLGDVCCFEIIFINQLLKFMLLHVMDQPHKDILHDLLMFILNEIRDFLYNFINIFLVSVDHLSCKISFLQLIIRGKQEFLPGSFDD